MLHLATPARANAVGCLCGSGLPYVDCHQPVDQAPAAERIDVARRAYATAWAGNTAHYERQGLYRRLAALLFEREARMHVLDLGCGRGNGMAALRETSRGVARLVGVDENPYCLNAAADRLGRGHPAERMHHIWRSNGLYETSYVAGRLAPLGSVALVHSDLLQPDCELGLLLDAAGPFDAVTLWFPGTHKAREDSAAVRAHRLATDERYAVAMELIAFRIAAARLRSDGLLHIVDRAAHAEADVVANAYRQKMLAMTEGTPFKLRNVRTIPYTEPGTGRRIPVGSPLLAMRPARTCAVSALLARS